jgi:transposase
VKAEHPGKRIRFFVQDEARIGQQGTLTRVWAPTGSRPSAVKQTQYEWLYVWAAVDPLTGESAAMITPTVNTDLMNTFLEGVSGLLAAEEHGIVVLDNAGWHVAKALKIPPNLTLLHLPPYSPELNSAENLWQFLRSHYLSNRAFSDYDDLLHHTNAALDKLNPNTLKSVCACPWLQRAIQA